MHTQQTNTEELALRYLRNKPPPFPRPPAPPRAAQNISPSDSKSARILQQKKIYIWL